MFSCRRYEAFDYYFEDEVIDEQYKNEQNLLQAYTLFSVLAIFIASLGLYGLILFVVQAQAKSISIRKVLGASSLDILIIIGKEFVIITAISFFIGWPIGWKLMDNWLNSFAFKVNIGVFPFIISALASLIIVLAIVLARGLNSAFENPINNLKQE